MMLVNRRMHVMELGWEMGMANRLLCIMELGLQMRLVNRWMHDLQLGWEMWMVYLYIGNCGMVWWRGWLVNRRCTHVTILLTYGAPYFTTNRSQYPPHTIGSDTYAIFLLRCHDQMSFFI